MLTNDHKTPYKNVDFLKKIEKYLMVWSSGDSYEIIYLTASFICEYERNLNLQTSSTNN
jgi:hypothetical protein